MIRARSPVDETILQEDKLAADATRELYMHTNDEAPPSVAKARQDKLKKDYDDVFAKFKAYFEGKRPMPTLPWFTTTNDLIEGIIQMEKLIRRQDAELAAAKQHTTVLKNQERQQNLETKGVYLTDAEINHRNYGNFLANERDATYGSALNAQRQQNFHLGLGPITNAEVAMQKGSVTADTADPGQETSFKWQRGLFDPKYWGLGKGGRSKRSKRVKRSKRSKRVNRSKRSSTKRH
jgi:hypothetical protein